MKMDVVKRFLDCWKNVERQKPLLYHITNFVSAAFQADVCHAIGASPVMSRSEKEAVELVRVSDALLVNTGTPNSMVVKTIHKAMDEASSTGKTILLDPVGFGSTEKRIDLVGNLLKRYPVSIIKGNAAEIALMAGSNGIVRGVDARAATRADVATLELAQRYGVVVIATGPVDYVSDGNKIFEVHGGSSMMGKISGGGCAVGSIVASIAGVSSGDMLAASLVGLMAAGMASEGAAHASGPGSFKMAFLDELYSLADNGLLPIEGRISVQDRQVG